MQRVIETVWRAIAAALVVLAAQSGFIGNAAAVPVLWDLIDHPGGGLAPPTYMLRLGYDSNKPNTFTVGCATCGVVMSFDPDVDTDKLTLSGTIQHNRGPSGPVAAGGLYQLSATFTGLTFSDPDADPDKWYGANPANAFYDNGAGGNTFRDLLDNSDDTPFNDEDFISSADRFYLEVIGMSLTHIGGTDSYAGLLDWNEFPNDPSDKQFFCQKNHRTTLDLLTCAGWLEPDESGHTRKTSDFLFAGTPSQSPEPSTLGLLGLGLVALGWRGRKRLS